MVRNKDFPGPDHSVRCKKLPVHTEFGKIGQSFASRLQ